MTQKLYPLIGSVFGNAVSHHDGKANANIRWCEECQKDADESKSGMGLGREITCWLRECREPGCATTFRTNGRCFIHGGKHFNERGADGRRIEPKSVRVLQPGHMMRCGIPWSIMYSPQYRKFSNNATNPWKGRCMQDLLATFGRRYSSPNYWTTNATRANEWIEVRTKGTWEYGQNGLPAKYHQTKRREYPRPYGLGGSCYVFATLDDAVPFVREKIQQWCRGKSGANPFQYEAALLQWVRLRHHPMKTFPKPINSRPDVHNRNGKEAAHGALAPQQQH